MPKSKRTSRRLTVCETAAGTWNYHLRIISDTEERCLQGKAGLTALCGIPVGWDTQMPLSVWGLVQSHIPQTWCKQCQRKAKALGFSLR